jgi:hypothetical protein
MPNISKDEYTAIIAGIVIIGGFVLLGIGKNSDVIWAISLVIGYYFGRTGKQPPTAN